MKTSQAVDDVLSVIANIPSTTNGQISNVLCDNSDTKCKKPSKSRRTLKQTSNILRIKSAVPSNRHFNHKVLSDGGVDNNHPSSANILQTESFYRIKQAGQIFEKMPHNCPYQDEPGKINKKAIHTNNFQLEKNSVFNSHILGLNGFGRDFVPKNRVAHTNGTTYLQSQQQQQHYSSPQKKDILQCLEIQKLQSNRGFLYQCPKSRSDSKFRNQNPDSTKAPESIYKASILGPTTTPDISYSQRPTTQVLVANSRIEAFQQFQDFKERFIYPNSVLHSASLDPVFSIANSNKPSALHSQTQISIRKDNKQLDDTPSKQVVSNLLRSRHPAVTSTVESVIPFVQSSQMFTNNYAHLCAKKTSEAQRNSSVIDSQDLCNFIKNQNYAEVHIGQRNTDLVAQGVGPSITGVGISIDESQSRQSVINDSKLLGKRRQSQDESILQTNHYLQQSPSSNRTSFKNKDKSYFLSYFDRKKLYDIQNKGAQSKSMLLEVSPVHKDSPNKQHRRAAYHQPQQTLTAGAIINKINNEYDLFQQRKRASGETSSVVQAIHSQANQKLHSQQQTILFQVLSSGKNFSPMKKHVLFPRQLSQASELEILNKKCLISSTAIADDSTNTPQLLMGSNYSRQQVIGDKQQSKKKHTVQQQVAQTMIAIQGTCLNKSIALMKTQTPEEEDQDKIQKLDEIVPVLQKLRMTGNNQQLQKGKQISRQVVSACKPADETTKKGKSLLTDKNSPLK